MRQLIVIDFLSLDGSSRRPAPTRIRAGGFNYARLAPWLIQRPLQEVGGRELDRAGGFLLGRRAYEGGFEESATIVEHLVADGSLPRGTVTFPFTDVEGAAGLLERLGRDHYSSAPGWA